VQDVFPVGSESGLFGGQASGHPSDLRKQPRVADQGEAEHEEQGGVEAGGQQAGSLPSLVVALFQELLTYMSMSQETLTQSSAESAVFAALADPVRRYVLGELTGGERPAGALAEGVPISRSAVSQHLAVLRNAGLVEHRRSGRQVWYRASRAGAASAAAWVARFTTVQLARSTAPGERVALQVSAVAVPVADQTRASRFYQDALGFSVVTDRTVEGWRWVSLLPAGGSCAIGLVQAQHTGVWTGISLLTDDITTLYHRWRHSDVAFDSPPVRQAWGARTALFADLDGNRLQLVEIPSGTVR